MNKINDKDLIELYIDQLFTEKNISMTTLIAYSNDLLNCSKYLLSNKNNFLSCKELTLSRWLEVINSKYKRSSAARKISVIKQFFNFIYIEKYRIDDPAKKLILPKKEMMLPKIISEKDICNLLNYLNKNKKSFKQLQILVLTELLYATGMRVSELVTLKLSNLTESFNHLIVKGKGNKERMLPIQGIIKKLLHKYINSTDYLSLKKKNKGDFWLFPSRNKHISRQTYFNKLKIAALASGLDYKLVSPHVLRHAFASHMLKNGADLKVIQYFLGHEDISTVEIYTHINLGETLKAIKKHPIAKHMAKE